MPRPCFCREARVFPRVRNARVRAPQGTQGLALRGGGQEYSSKDAEKYDRVLWDMLAQVRLCCMSGRARTPIACSRRHCGCVLSDMHPHVDVLTRWYVWRCVPLSVFPCVALACMCVVLCTCAQHPDEIHFLNTVFNFLQRRTPCFNGAFAE